MLTWIGNDLYHFFEAKTEKSNNVQTITELIKEEKLTSEDMGIPKLPFNIGGGGKRISEKNRKTS